MLQRTSHLLRPFDFFYKGESKRSRLEFFNDFYKKFAPLSIAALLLVGCGFQPLMSGEHETPQRFTLKINGNGYSTYKFRRELEKQLALTPKINDKPYIVVVSVSEGYVPVAYGTDATVARSQIQAMANYVIHDGDKVLAKGNATAYSSYILNYTEEFSTRSAQAAASERTLLSLSEELAREIMLKIRSAPEKPDKEKKETESEKADKW